MPVIRVDEKVYKQLEKAANENFRGLGAQVAYLVANDCPHPPDERERVAMIIEGNTRKTVTICRQCKRVLS